MLITKEFIRSLDPCTDGYKWWCEKYGESVALSEFVKAADEKWEYVLWLSVRLLTHKSQVMFAVWCAEYVVHLSQNQEIAQSAIAAAKKWIDDPSEENRKAAANAAEAAGHAATYTDTYANSIAGCSAAYAADAAVYVYAAAYAAASAASAADKTIRKVAMAYLLTLETK